VSDNGKAQSGMGVDLADADGDGLPDLFVTNYHRENNNLYRNLGDGLFQDVAANSPPGGSNEHRVCFGTGMVDLNNDGWRDVYVTAGHVLIHPEDATPGAGRFQNDQLFVGLGKGQFREVTAEAGAWFKHEHIGRGAAFGDVDNDGDLDVLMVPNIGKVALLMNQGGNAGHWLRLQLEGRKSNRDGVGATIRVVAGGLTQRAEARSAYSYCSASDIRVHFGLGAAVSAGEVEVRWPSGQVDTLRNLAADRTYHVVEGEGVRQAAPR
jgi:hypothetical protein